jgi:hypothetical protein
VPERSAHLKDVGASLELQSREGVPQIVEPLARRAGRRERGMQIARDVLRAERVARARAEDEAPSVPPPGLPPRRGLLDAMA